jgi:hypothetical protein
MVIDKNCKISNDFLTHRFFQENRFSFQKTGKSVAGSVLGREIRKGYRENIFGHASVFPERCRVPEFSGILMPEAYNRSGSVEFKRFINSSWRPFQHAANIR